MLTKANDLRSRWAALHVPLLVLAGLLGLVEPVAAQNAANRQDRITSPLQMYAGGTRPAGPTVGTANASVPSATRLFTIVGAVQRSGVYETDKQQIRVESLLEAAGGLTEESTGILRIIRDGRPRLQMMYRPGSTDTIFAGDIVVAAGRSAGRWQPGGSGVVDRQAIESEALVPIACIGVINRPIVLPLAVDHANRRMLARLLGQAPDVMSAVQVWSAGRPLSTDRLVAGDVLDFSRAALDVAALSRLESFPAVLPLTPPEPTPQQTEASLSVNQQPAEPAAMPTVTTAPQPPVIVHRPHEASPQAEPTPLSGGSGLAAPSIPANEEPAIAMASAPREAAPELPIESPTSLLDTEPIEASAPSTVPTPSTAGLEPIADPEGEIEDDAPAPVVTSIPSALPKAEPSQAAPAPSIIQEGMSSDALPTLAAHEASSAEEAADLFAGLAAKAENGTTTASDPNVLWPLIIGLSVILLTLIAGTTIWSKYMPLESQEPAQRAPMSPSSEVPTTEAKQTKVTTPTSEIALETETSDSVMDSVVREVVELVEEPTEIPKGFQYHGDPVGHRRIAIHDRHEELRGPHFVPQPKAGEQSAKSGSAHDVSAAERRLRQLFRHDTPHKTEERSRVVESTSDETPASIDEPIVDDRSREARRTRSPIAAGATTSSPLERALRYLENEAHS